ncbi:hypothetical protein L1049_004711 [Liquidambar formosana]|uniref:Uncharacterized protein n=1 Tax=Liquidambar formosana TaxID=63359 RepID=A0AAP0RPP3_LIQFO
MGWKAAQKLIRNWKVLRGYNVMIDKGETGIIKRVIHSQNCVIVEAKNLLEKKHIKQGKVMKGGFLQLKPHFMPQMFKLTLSQGIDALQISHEQPVNHSCFHVCFSFILSRRW